jgi:hypothetical protein
MRLAEACGARTTSLTVHTRHSAAERPTHQPPRTLTRTRDTRPAYSPRPAIDNKIIRRYRSRL